MNEYQIGIDPDSDKSGVAIAKNGELCTVKSMCITQLVPMLAELSDSGSVTVHIEDVCGISSSAFNHSRKDTRAVRFKKSEHVGMCKQAQIVIQKFCAEYGIPVHKHKVSKAWKETKTGRAALKSVFGWTGESNEDSRSAAYFLYLGMKSNNI